MKVFLGWSGERSRSVASALHNWIPNIIQAVKSWMSEEDIDKGRRWSPELAAELDQAAFGIVCVTPENWKAPWLIFEAGALAKSLDKAFLCPYLLGLEPTDIEGPLAQFQATRAERGETRRMMLAINHALKADALPDQMIERQLDQWWPHLEQELGRVASLDSVPRPQRDQRELLEEILGLVRAEARDSRVLAQTREGFSELFLRLMGAANVSPELVRAFEQSLLPTRQSGPRSLIRTHKPDSGIYIARVRQLANGEYRAVCHDPQNLIRPDVFIDRKDLEFAKEMADLLVFEVAPHDCDAMGCGVWRDRGLLVDMLDESK